MKPCRSRRSTPRTRTGCRGCRIRRKKCDEDRLACSGCVRNELLCSFAPDDLDSRHNHFHDRQNSQITKIPDSQQSTTPLSEGRAKQISSIPLSLSDPIRSGIYAPWDKERVSCLLFEHYSSKTADQICGLLNSGNPFITCIIPLARADRLVMHSVLALSGAHMIYRRRTII